MPTVVDRGLTEDYTPMRLDGRGDGAWYPEPAWRRALRKPFVYAYKRYLMWRYNLPDPDKHQQPEATPVVQQWPSTPEEIELNERFNRFYDAHISAIEKRLRGETD